MVTSNYYCNLWVVSQMMHINLFKHNSAGAVTGTALLDSDIRDFTAVTVKAYKMGLSNRKNPFKIFTFLR